MNNKKSMEVSLFGLLFLVTISFLIHGNTLRASSSSGLSTQHFLAWIIEVTYPVADSGEPGRTVSVNWRFQIKQREMKKDGEWWWISVKEESGSIQDSAQFLFQPDSGLIADLQIIRWLRGRAYIHSDLDVPSSLCLGDVHFIPVVFVSRKINGSGGEKAGISRVSITRETDSQHRYRDTYQVRVEKSSTSSEKVLDVSHERNTECSWRFVWRGEFPWWSSCETPAYSARLIRVEGDWPNE